MNEDFLLIGIDGGATKVSGWSLNVEGENKFSLGEYNAILSYRDQDGYIEDFESVDIQKQLDEFQTDDIHPTDEEKQHGHTYIQAAAKVVKKLVEMSGINKVLIGEGMPGLKTRDGRGISVMANGPRNIHYCDEMEQILKEAGIKLIEPIAKLGSDAFYCGIGEEYATDGQFRQVENSYYLGGGTGTADALKLKGELVSLDDIKDWFVKTWELKDEDGLSLEKCASAQGIQSIYADYSGQTVQELNANEIYPLQIREKALQDNGAAAKTFETVTKDLAKLIYERISTLYSGWQGLFSFVNENKKAPSNQHNYKKTVFDSIIIGQRLGELFKEARDDNILWKPFFKKLSIQIKESEVLDDEAQKYYCPEGKFNEYLLKISKLREAPALGAGIDAYLTYKNGN